MCCFFVERRGGGVGLCVWMLRWLRERPDDELIMTLRLRAALADRRVLLSKSYMSAKCDYQTLPSPSISALSEPSIHSSCKVYKV